MPVFRGSPENVLARFYHPPIQPWFNALKLREEYLNGKIRTFQADSGGFYRGVAKLLAKNRRILLEIGR